MSDPKIKFVAVELLKKGVSSATSVEYGLLKGIKIRSDGDTDKPEVTSFVLIEKQENSIHAFNLANFNILSIGSRCDNVKELVIYKSHEADQKKAVLLLTNFFEQLVKDKRTIKNDPELIDVDTYQHLPGGIKKPKSLYPTNNNSGSCNTRNNSTDDWQKKKEEKEKEEARQEELRKIPTMLERDGEIPGVKALNLMKKKVTMIAGGDYKSDIVPSKEIDEEEKPKSNVVGYIG